MKLRSTSLLLTAVMALAPMTRVSAGKHHDEHVTDAEMAAAGLVIAGLAVAASQSNNGHVHPKPPSEAEPTSYPVTIYKDGRPKTIYLTQLKPGGYLGPRGEFYDVFPSDEQLQKTYGNSGGGGNSGGTLDAKVSQGKVTVTRGGRAMTVVRPALPNVEEWRFSQDKEFIIVKSRANHGPAMIEKFRISDGTLVDKIMASSVTNERWAKPFAD